jgi:SAM-dependent methyltransferase
MSSFNEDYATYYDLLYRDKDYAGEAKFVRGLLKQHAPKARSLIELGCGTARHAREMIASGYRVLGVDLSERMIARAIEESSRLPARQRKHLRLVQGDVSRFQTDERFDAAISLFHVANYQTTNDALRGYFHTASRALRTGGVFIFDFWYGPAVLTDRPAVRIKRAETTEVRVTRLAEPSVDVNRSLVTVNYTLLAQPRAGGSGAEFTEQHTVRYLFLPELEHFAASAGFTLLETGEWLTRQPLSDHTWFGYLMMRRRG